MRTGLGRLTAAALVAGVLTGFIGALFHLSLDAVNVARDGLIGWARGLGPLGVLIPVVFVAVGVAVARSLVRLAPLAAGSGIQQVEATVRYQAAPAGLAVLPVKFAGGVLAIGSGLALGREGPTVQIGATIGSALARLFRLGPEDQQTMPAALAGAGLGVAFNAPLGGIFFVFEELTGAFRPRLTLATIVGAAAAMSVSRRILGRGHDFQIAAVALPSFGELAAFFVLGVLVGAVGLAYGRAVVAGLELFDLGGRWPVEWRAGLVGAAVGLLAWLAPTLVGDGHPLNQRLLTDAFPLASLALIAAVRWVLGPLSYAVGTPGGLFAPLLLVGAATGSLFGAAARAVGIGMPPQSALAVAGMVGFFAAVVQAPLTGVALVIEMTATTSFLGPMLTTGVAAILTTTLLRSRPIYDVLRERMRPPSSCP